MAQHVVGPKWPVAASVGPPVLDFSRASWDPADPLITTHSDLVAFICASDDAPYIQDLKGTISKTTFASGYRDVSAVATNRSALPLASYTIAGLSVPALRINGALTVRVLFAVQTAQTQAIAQMTASGDTESANKNWALFTADTSGVRFFCESDSGINRDATWTIPGGTRTGLDKPFLISAYRSAAGVVKMYWGDWQLMHIRSVDGVVNAGNGSATGFNPTGGGSTTFEFKNNQSLQMGFLGVYNADDNANHDSFVGGIVKRGEISEDELKFLSPSTSVQTQLAADGGTVSLLVPDSTKSSGWNDVKGYLDGNAATQNSTAVARLKKGTQVNYWCEDTAIFDTSTKTDLRINSNLTIRCLVEYDNSDSYVIAHQISSETEPKNYLYSISFDSPTVIQVLWESGAGTNRTSKFTLPSAVTRGQIVLLSIVRHDIGSGDCNLYCYLNGSRLNVASVSGMTNNTNFTTGPLPTGGQDGVLHLLNNDTSNAAKFAKMIHIVAGVDAGATPASFDTREATVAALLGVA